jgi:hypothetical protein
MEEICAYIFFVPKVNEAKRCHIYIGAVKPSKTIILFPIRKKKTLDINAIDDRSP